MLKWTDSVVDVLMDTVHDGTIPRILDLVGLKLKVMVASGDDDKESLELMGEKVLGHVWQPTQDKFIFRIVVNLTPAKVKKRSQKAVADLTKSDIPRLVSMRLTKRCLLGFVNSQYDPMGLICPLLIILKINLRDLFGTEVEIGWDDPLSEDLHERWVKIITMFLQIGDIILDRAVRPHGVEDVPELIGF